ncbi:MAG: 4Fe-4S dicluster domain-containing protein [Clostridia bacterium]|nr:4Fe-4S dicluster domain-containing protein [Clostridia bacterium]
MALKRGARLLFQKEPAISLPTAELNTLPQVILPYAFPTDATVIPTVHLYDTVRKGTRLSTVEDDPISAVCSSVTGLVSGEREIQHPLYGTLSCVVIDCLPDNPTPEVPTPASEQFTPEYILQAAKEAGIVDELDGVPLSLKLQDWQTNGCGFLVVDAVEIEPFSSSAWAVLHDYAEQVLEGLRMLARCAGVTRYHIAVCLSGARRRALTLRIGKPFLYQTDSYYPVTDIVHRGKKFGTHSAPHSATVGRVGVQACLALYRALFLSEPHSRCVVTVAGDAVPQPQNVSVPFGATLQQLLEFCDVSDLPDYVIVGEQMTGTAVSSLDIPVLPGMTCLLAFSTKTLRTPATYSCVGCGRCAQSCHAGLLPFEIVRRHQNMHYERLSSLRADECDGCNACSFVCPSGIPLASIVEEAKAASGAVFLDMEDSHA